MTSAERFPPDSIHQVSERQFIVTGYRLTSALLRDDRVRPGTTGLPGLEPLDREPVQRLFNDMILFQLPPRHRVIRGLLQVWFTPPSVARLQSLIDDICDRVIENARMASDGIDFVETVARIVPLDVIGELLGIPESDRANVGKRTDRVVQAMWHTVADLRAADGAAVLLDRYFRRLTEARRDRPGQDLLSALIADGSLSDDEIVANLVFLIIAATFTSGDFLSSAMVMAIHDHEFRAMLRRGDDVEACIEEALRLHPPIAHVVRNTAEDIDVGLLTIPADSILEFDMAAANRDPTEFDDPDAFRPSRSPRKSLSFGMGAHYCAGWALGRAEAATLLPRFLAAFPVIELTGEVMPKQHPFQQGYQRVPLRLSEFAPVGHR
ncbi:MAG TPA: cytochrome P450 [Micromonosporaceae bacterium]|jgi:cytochrome P450